MTHPLVAYCMYFYSAVNCVVYKHRQLINELKFVVSGQGNLIKTVFNKQIMN